MSDRTSPTVSDSSSDLEQLRRDWRQGSREAPEITLRALRRRLSRRWLMVAVEAAVLLGCAVLLVRAAFDTEDLMDWIYWGFFAVYFAALVPYGLRLRWTALLRRDDSAGAILDHAWRDAAVRRAGGALALRATPLVWAFVIGWLIADGLLDGHSLRALFDQYALLVAFVSLFCLSAAFVGALTLQKGRRQQRELTRLADELADGPAGAQQR